MRRLAVIGIMALGVGLGTTLAFGAPQLGGFGQGVAAGEITSTSAMLWTRAPRLGSILVRVNTEPLMIHPTVTRLVRPKAADDYTVSVRIAGLRPGTRYFYDFVGGTGGHVASPMGVFTTAPRTTADVRVRFAYSGDADATSGPDGRPGFNGFQVYGRMAAEGNDFNINLGDTIYSDSELAGQQPALTVAAKWQKYRLGLGLAPLRRLRAATGLYSHWDDHEFVNDFSRAENGDTLYAAGVKAFTDYAPVTYRARTGLYRTVRWGRNLELFFLDERSFRSAKAATVCEGDIAPTAPAAVRTAFAAIAPALAKPVSAGCLETLNDPSRTMLGTAQYAAFAKAIAGSTARWKVIVNEVPMLQLYALPYDRWEGYAAERTRLLDVLRGIRNVVVLTTDTHAHLIGEIRTTTFEPPGPDSTGVWEVVTGPVATNTYAKEIDGFLGAKGSGDFVTSLFFKPAAPRGLGLRCAATDVFGYAEVTVTATTLRVQPKNAVGAPVVEKTGATCAPLVLHAS